MESADFAKGYDGRSCHKMKLPSLIALFFDVIAGAISQSVCGTFTVWSTDIQNDFLIAIKDLWYLTAIVLNELPENDPAFFFADVPICETCNEWKKEGVD